MNEYIKIANLDSYETSFIENNIVELPSLVDSIEEIINRVVPLYKEFIDKGVFYEQKHHYEYGRQYVRIFKTDGVGDPYETIGDWAQELTGAEKFFSGFTGEIYEDLIREIVREYVEDILGEYFEEIQEFYCFVEIELLGDFLYLPIETLEKRF